MLAGRRYRRAASLARACGKQSKAKLRFDSIGLDWIGLDWIGLGLCVWGRPHCASENLSIKDISKMTAIKPEDVIATLQVHARARRGSNPAPSEKGLRIPLQSLNLLRYWKGQHILSISPKVT